MPSPPPRLVSEEFVSEIRLSGGVLSYHPCVTVRQGPSYERSKATVADVKRVSAEGYTVISARSLVWEYKDNRPVPTAVLATSDVAYCNYGVRNGN